MNKIIEDQVVEDSPTEETHHTITKTYPTTAASVDRAFVKKKVVFRADQIIWFILGLIEVLLIFRFVLKFLGAYYSGFTLLIYDISAPFTAPFAGTFNVHYIGNSIFEWTTLLAMVVYYILAWGINKALRFYKPAEPAEVDRKTEEI